MQASLMDTLLRGSTLHGKSSAPLGWDGFILERRKALPHERPEEMMGYHHLLLWCGKPTVAEREYRGGVFQRITKYPGTLSLGAAGRLPAVRAHSAYDVVACLIDPAMADRVSLESNFNGKLHINEHLGMKDPTLAKLVSCCVQEVEEGGVTGRLYGESLVFATICRFLFLASKESGKVLVDNPLPHRTLRRILDMIETEFHRDIGLLELARESGYSRAHFLRMFRAATGKTPHRYLLDVRLERARDQLQSGSEPITEIALSCGFSSHSHLTRLFHQRFTITPSMFRRNR